MQKYIYMENNQLNPYGSKVLTEVTSVPKDAVWRCVSPEGTEYFYDARYNDQRFYIPVSAVMEVFFRRMGSIHAYRAYKNGLDHLIKGNKGAGLLV